MVRRMPLGVMPKIELAEPPEVGIGVSGIEVFMMISSMGEEDIWMGVDRVRNAREDARTRRERNNKNIDEREREKNKDIATRNLRARNKSSSEER